MEKIRKLSDEEESLLDIYLQKYFEGDKAMGVKIADIFYEVNGTSIGEYETVYDLYLEAAKLGNMHAASRVSSLIVEKKVIENDSNLAAYWNYRSQEANGDKEAVLQLGRWHKERLLECKKSCNYIQALSEFRKSLEWYEKAIINEDSKAMYEAAQLCEYYYPRHNDYVPHHARLMESVNQESEMIIKYYKKGKELGEEALKHGNCVAILEKLRKAKEDLSVKLWKDIEILSEQVDREMCTELFAELGEEYMFSKIKEISDESKGKELIEKGIALKDPLAYYVQGRVYEEKRNDKENAIVWYERAADCDNTKALRRLGDIYTELDERKNDLNAIKGLWYYLRLYTFEKYEENLNLINNIEEKILNFDLEGEEFIFKYWCKAAIHEDENSSIMVDIGKMYMSERCIIDYERAYRWFEKAVNHGETRCLNDIGCLLRYGLGVQKDEKRAYDFFDKASAAGNASGIKNKADLLYKKEKFEESKKMYIMAAQEGEVEAIRNLEILFDISKEKVTFKSQCEKDGYQLERFADLCALDIGNTRLLTEIGIMYEEGVGCLKEDEKAYKLYMAALESPIAKRRLGKMELQSDCYLDREKGIENLKKAGKAGDIIAMEILGEYYHNTLYNSEVDALKWYEQAVQCGSTKVITKLGKLYFDMKNFEKAYELCIQQTNNKECYLILGHLYAQGLSPKGKDVNQALYYFEKAASLGSLEGRYEKCLLKNSLKSN